MVQSQSEPNNISSQELRPDAVGVETLPTAPETPSLVDAKTEAMALAIADAMDDRKGEDIVLLKLADVSYIADYFVIGTAQSRALSTCPAKGTAPGYSRITATLLCIF